MRQVESSASSGSASVRMLFSELHGISLPDDVDYCINFGEKGKFGLSCIVINAEKIPIIMNQLKIMDQAKPVANVSSDPNVLGWGPWPVGFSSFIPSIDQMEGKKLYSGLAVPVEEFSCESKTGNWLHVDLWNTVEGSGLLRFYTDWD